MAKKAEKSITKKPVKVKKRAVKSVKKTSAKAPAKKKVSEADKFFEAVGRRKTAVARVRLFTKGGKGFLINDKNYQDYFSNFELQKIILAPLEMMKSEDKFQISIKVRGGGIHAQAEAARHGLSRALIKFNPDFRKRLKKVGFLTRDPRMRERKKFGLKRARRGPQFSKR